MSAGPVMKLTRNPERDSLAKMARIKFGDVSDAALLEAGLRALATGIPSAQMSIADAVATDGARLRRARARAGLGQGRLAKKLGYEHRSSVGNIEIGRAPLVGAARTMGSRFADVARRVCCASRREWSRERA